MQFRYSQTWLNSGDTVVMDSNYACNFMVMDSINFMAYKSGRSFRYYGGHFSHFPAGITVPHSGNFYVVVDLGGRRGMLSYNLKVLKAA